MSDLVLEHDLIIAGLLNPATIRIQAHRLLQLGREGALSHFAVNDEALPACADFVVNVMHANYPDGNIPYHSRWRHFEVGGLNRLIELKNSLAEISPLEWGQICYELVIISVLLDAGAGDTWRFTDALSGQVYQRSEGLALASLALYQQGVLSQDKTKSYRVDGQALQSLDEATFARIFQVTDTNPLAGLAGRVQLLNSLGRVVSQNEAFFGAERRLGYFFTVVRAQACHDTLSASVLFAYVLRAFQPIWPLRTSYQGVALGDVWMHAALETGEAASAFIPFHKLSQWLTYSLVEPLEWCGITVTDLDALTGLPEYRNGGLLIDLDVLQIKDKQLLESAQLPSSEAIIEWRALTVALLDELALMIRSRLGLSKEALPLAKVLQGGTWAAGRQIAAQKRPGGTPPIQLISDGTVF